MPENPDGSIRRAYIDSLTDRYRVLVMDYPDQGPNLGRSRKIAPNELTVERVCEDMLAVADAAGFDRFAWWGYSWGGLIGLHLAAHSARVAALVCGGWSPLGETHRVFLHATRALAEDPPAGFPIPPAQFYTFYNSIRNWNDIEGIRAIRCPRLAYVGSVDVWEGGGFTVKIAEALHTHRSDLVQQGWDVVDIPGRDHLIYQNPEIVVPIVRPFLDRSV